MDIEQVKIKKHFYYCIFIALLMEIKSGSIKNNKQKKRFLLEWMKRARKEKMFQEEAEIEITWLKNKLISDKAVLGVENMLHNIYTSAFIVGIRLNNFEHA